MKKILKAVALSGLLTLSNNAFTADWFKVEVIVFANNASEPLSAEYWPSITDIPENKRATYLGGQGEGAYQRLPGSSLNLIQAKNSLRTKGDYKVLFHSAWMQPVHETQKPRPIKIRGGEILDNGLHELEGYIAVGRGRYLHFRPDLYLNRRLTAAESAMLKNPLSSQPSAEESQVTLSMQTTSSADVSLGAIDLPDILTVNLNQARRMRSKELHYIDHPLMGILVEITPAD